MQPGFIAGASNSPLLEDVAMRAANRAVAEERKKRKDDKKTRMARREKAKLDRGNRHRGLDEEDNEEEEEEGD